MESYSFNKKSIFTFGSLFVLLIVVYLFALYLSSALPSEKIKANIAESTQMIKDQEDWIDPVSFNPYWGPLTINIGTDAIMMNVIYNIDSESPLKSSLLNKFYGNYDFYDCIPNLVSAVDGDAQIEYTYARYWHGYIAVWRPLFAFFNYPELRALNFFVFSILVLLLLVCTAKKAGYFTALALSLSWVYINFWCIPMAFQYLSVFDLMLTGSLIIMIFDIQKESFYLKLFFIMASLTAFFDFLTVPLITFGIPFIYILIKHESDFKKQSFRQIFMFLFKLGLCWVLGYILTWLMKIAIVSMIDKDVVMESIRQLQFRMNGQETENGFFAIRYVSIYRNLKSMFFETNLLRTLFILFFFISSWFVFRKKDQFSSVFYIYLVIAMIPYLWYLFAANHSMEHFAFTYRLQMMTVFGLLLAYRNSVDMSKFKGRIKKFLIK